MSRISQQEEGLLNHTQAAAILEISSRRIGELVKLAKLTRFDFLGRTYVSVREVLQRLNTDIKPGRPSRATVQRIRATAKVVDSYDALNAATDVITLEPKKKEED